MKLLEPLRRPRSGLNDVRGARQGKQNRGSDREEGPRHHREGQGAVLQGNAGLCLLHCNHALYPVLRQAERGRTRLLPVDLPRTPGGMAARDRTRRHPALPGRVLRDRQGAGDSHVPAGVGRHRRIGPSEHAALRARAHQAAAFQDFHNFRVEEDLRRPGLSRVSEVARQAGRCRPGPVLGPAQRSGRPPVGHDHQPGRLRRRHPRHRTRDPVRDHLRRRHNRDRRPLVVEVPLAGRAEDDQAGGQGRAEADRRRSAGQDAHPLGPARPCPPPHDECGSQGHAGDRQPDPLFNRAALCPRRRRRPGRRRQGTGPRRPAYPRDRRRARNSGVRGRGPRPLHVQSSFGG